MPKETLLSFSLLEPKAENGSLMFSYKPSTNNLIIAESQPLWENVDIIAENLKYVFFDPCIEVIISTRTFSEPWLKIIFLKGPKAVLENTIQNENVIRKWLAERSERRKQLLPKQNKLSDDFFFHKSLDYPEVKKVFFSKKIKDQLIFSINFIDKKDDIPHRKQLSELLKKLWPEEKINISSKIIFKKYKYSLSTIAPDSIIKIFESAGLQYKTKLIDESNTQIELESKTPRLVENILQQQLQKKEVKIKSQSVIETYRFKITASSDILEVIAEEASRNNVHYRELYKEPSSQDFRQLIMRGLYIVLINSNSLQGIVIKEKIYLDREGLNSYAKDLTSRLRSRWNIYKNQITIKLTSENFLIISAPPLVREEVLLSAQKASRNYDFNRYPCISIDKHYGLLLNNLPVAFKEIDKSFVKHDKFHNPIFKRVLQSSIEIADKETADRLNKLTEALLKIMCCTELLVSSYEKIEEHYVLQINIINDKFVKASPYIDLILTVSNAIQEKEDKSVCEVQKVLNLIVASKEMGKEKKQAQIFTPSTLKIVMAYCFFSPPKELKLKESENQKTSPASKPCVLS